MIKGGNRMITMPETVIDRVLHLPENQIPKLITFLETLTESSPSKINVYKRIGVAEDITFPSDFDDIDYGTNEAFGLNE